MGSWQFKQFAELSAAVKAHWDRSSAARAKLANRHRRTVDLKLGDRVVWNAPKARSEGAGRVPFPGLTGPWRVKDVRGHLEPVPDVPGVPFRVLRALWRLTPRTVSSCPRTRRRLCLANPSSSRTKTMITGRGRDFILRLGERVVCGGARGGPKSCRLGRVTQVDQFQGAGGRASLPARSVRR